MLHSFALTAVAVLFSFAQAPAQRAWDLLGADPLTGRGLGVFDTARGVTVYFVGTEGVTREWDGTRWSLASTDGPSVGNGYAMAFDQQRTMTLLFDESTGATWAWDGTQWSSQTMMGPGPRESTAMAYDPMRDRTVLHGGVLSGSELQDTWEFDGTQWTRVATSGPAVGSHSMVFDAARSQLLLVGGRVGSLFGTSLRDTWVWDGSGWTLLDSTGPMDGMGALTYDSARSLVVRTTTSSSPFLPFATWEWDGSAWRSHSMSTLPGLLGPDSIVYDPVRDRTFGFNLNLHFVYDGFAWSELRRSPDTWADAMMAYDSGRDVLVAVGGRGLMGTNEWSPSTGWRLAGTGGPSAIYSSAAAYDPGRGVVVVFGGRAPGFQFFGETWEWDGQSWTMASPGGGPNEPEVRSDSAMVYDPVRGQMLLFGGADDNLIPLDDTWAWDGVQWSQLSPATTPPARSGHAMAFDSLRGRVVMHGGTTGTSANQATGDLWEFDGVDWSRPVQTGAVPGAMVAHGMAFDEARGRTVLLGAANGAAVAAEWDGQRWEILPGFDFSPPSGHSMAYFASLARVVVYGGANNQILRGALTVLRTDRVGSACRALTGVLELSVVDDRPGVGATVDAEVTGAPASAMQAMGLVGFDRVAPPMDLSGIGMPSCYLYFDPVVATRTVPVVSGAARFSLAVPANPSLVGLQLMLQAAVVDAGANALGVALSNASVTVVR